MLGPEPELGRDGCVPGNDPELGDLFFGFAAVIVRQIKSKNIPAFFTWPKLTNMPH
jgi:hypothetical protein